MGQHVAGQEVRQRLGAITDLVHRLQEAKRKQDAQCLPGAKTGVWLSFQLWNRMLRQLNTQMAEILEWEQLLVGSQKDLSQAVAVAHTLENELVAHKLQSQDKVAGLEEQVVCLQRDMEAKEADWEHARKAMGQQTGLLLEDLSERAGVLRDNEQLLARLRAMDGARVRAETAGQAAAEHLAELQKKLTYLEGKHADVLSERDQLSGQARELGLQLAGSREQLEAHKQLLAVRRQPSDQMLDECRTLRDDNRRLVALLGATKEWRGMAERMGQEEGRERYIPMHEVLHHKGGVQGLYPGLEDRPKVSKAGRGGETEEWNWVPHEAVEIVKDAVAAISPNAPSEPLFHMLLRVNKIWRRREAAAIEALRRSHAQELRELHGLYRQRAPYEAVVGRTRLAELKRQLRVQAMHAQHLADRAAGDAKVAAEDSKVVLTLGLESVHSLSQEVGHLNKKATRLRRRLAAKERKPPVCASCLDSMLLQAVPLQDLYLTKSIGREQLASPSATAIPTAPDTTGPNHARPAAAPQPSVLLSPFRPGQQAGPAGPLQAAADQYTANLATKAGAAGAPGPGGAGAAGACRSVSSDEGTVKLAVGAGGGDPQSPGSTVCWPVAAEARVGRLANLIREYERPVLQFSRWDKDGSLRGSDRVADVSTGAVGQVQVL